tara:strand:- start:156 stop:599 length:444 start_codon:yes stop_codon:yes gene_type:complete
MDLVWKRDGVEYTSLEILDILSGHDEVYIGSDSKYFRQFVKYATVICVNLNPGITYWYCSSSERNVAGDIRTRITTEVNKSMDVALWISEHMKDIKISVHCDINSDPRFASNRFHVGARGYITGCGFEYVSKPDSWAASGCADWHTK